MANYEILNKLQLYKGEHFAGLVDEAMLGNALKTEPYRIPQIVSWIFGTLDSEYSATLELITGGIGNKMVIDKPTYEWEIQIEMERAVTIRRAEYNGATVTAASTFVGINNTPIKLFLDMKWLNLYCAA